MLFHKKRQQDPESLLQETWSSSFRWFEKKRFPKEETPDYRSHVSRRRFGLDIRQANCFAWVTGPYQYADFVIEATASIDPDNGYSSTGFVFRLSNEDNFYYFLLSNRGHFRFDVVFNRTPSHLIEWTPCPKKPEKSMELRIVARGDRFFFYLGDEWIAEASDSTLSQGHIGFAAQNYDEKEKGSFYLENIRIESRPVAVEREYLRWTRYVPASPEPRITLAWTFSDMGKYEEAVAQLKTAFRLKTGTAEELLLLARAYAQLRAYPESLAGYDRVLQLEPKHARASLEKADVLYLNGEFLRCREYLESILSDHPEDAELRGLLGGSEYALGNWDSARRRYEEALALQPDNAVLRVNLARCWERAGNRDAAVESYLEAARQLFKQEIHDELSLVIARAGALVPEGSAAALELKSLEAKMLYQEGRKRQAELMLSELIVAGHPDSGVHYLYALLLVEAGRRREALRHLSRAVELEPGYALYWFRLAENRFLLGEDPGSALEEARRLDPEDPWINNLYGQVLLQAGESEMSLPYFQRAREAAPEQGDIYRNNAESLMNLGRNEEARRLLSEAIERCGQKDHKAAELYNQRGNCLVELREFASALRDYERALELDPENRVYMENCAACCLELDMVMRTEDLLNRLLEGGESPSLYNLTGNLAALKGEYERARLAYLEALKLESSNLEVRLNLLALYVETGRYEPAKELLEGLLALEPLPEKVRALQQRVRDKFEQHLDCTGCGRQWWLPRDVAPQPAFTIRGEPPGQAPAGRCEQCGSLYCIACAAVHVQDGLLLCPKCRRRLRLSEDPLKYLVLRYVEADSGSA